MSSVKRQQPELSRIALDEKMPEASNETVSIDLLTIDENSGRTIFRKAKHPLTDRNGMWISERQTALNFRHRLSHPGYESGWHTSGDPTLIIVLKGQITIELRDGTSKTFHSGQQFIAADYRIDNVADESDIGHKAYVFGNDPLQAVHIKLSTR